MATTTGGDIKINITGDSVPLVEALGKAQVGLDKTTAAAAKTATSVQKITVSSDAVSTSMSTASKAFEKSGSSLMKVAGAASMVNPELGELFRNLGDVADVGEVATQVSGGFVSQVAALGPVLAIAVGALSSAYLVLQDYTAGSKAAAAADAARMAAMVPLEEALASARAENELLTQAQGATKEELQAYLATAKAHAEIDAKVAASTADLRAEQEALKASLAGSADEYGTTEILARNRLAQLDAEIGAANEAGDELKRLSDANEDLRGSLKGATDGVKDQTDAVVDAYNADAVWAQALAESTIYNLDAAAEASTRRAKIEKENADIIARATEESAARQMEAEEALRVRRIEIAEEQAEQYRQGIEDRKELDRQYAEAAAAVAQAALQVASDIADAEYDKRAETIEKLQQRLEEGEETLTTAQKKELKARIAANKEAATTAFNVAKAAAAAQAAISTALAVANALATPGVPYPVAVGFAIAAGIAGAASTVAILAEAPPKFHAGGVRGDEMSATVLPGEGVINRQGMNTLGAEGLNAINHGGSAPAPAASFRIGRLEAKEIARTDIRANGAIPQAIRTFVNRSSNGTGLSGRLAIR